MPRPHIAMRKIRDVLRLSFGEGLSRRQVAASLGLPRATVADYVKRAEAGGLKWPLSEDFDDDKLEAVLFPGVSTSESSRPLPDWQKVHLELRRPHVTLMLLWHEYKSHCQELWTRNLTQAATDPSSVSVSDAATVVVSLLSCSLPSMNVAPARTSGTSSAPVIFRQRAWAESSSL